MKKFMVILLVIISIFMTSICNATTLLDIRTEVRKYLFDNAPGVNSYQAFLNAQIDENINQAQMYLLDVLPLSANYNLIKTASLTIVNNQKDYDLPTGFRKIITVQYNNKPALQVKPEEFYSKIKSASVDKDPMFTILDSKIRLFPTPVTGNTAEVMYISTVAPLTTEASVISTLTEHDRLLTILSVHFLLLSVGDTTHTTASGNLISLLLGSKVNSLFNTNIVEKPLVTPTPVQAK